MSLAKLAEEERIYRTRENRAWCKERGIRITRHPLGRPPARVSPEEKKQAVKYERIRNAVCLKIQDSRKRIFGLNRVWQNLIMLLGQPLRLLF